MRIAHKESDRLQFNSPTKLIATIGGHCIMYTNLFSSKNIQKARMLSCIDRVTNMSNSANPFKIHLHESVKNLNHEIRKKKVQIFNEFKLIEKQFLKSTDAKKRFFKGK